MTLRVQLPETDVLERSGRTVAPAKTSRTCRAVIDISSSSCLSTVQRKSLLAAFLFRGVCKLNQQALQRAPRANTFLPAYPATSGRNDFPECGKLSPQRCSPTHPRKGRRACRAPSTRTAHVMPAPTGRAKFSSKELFEPASQNCFAANDSLSKKCAVFDPSFSSPESVSGCPSFISDASSSGSFFEDLPFHGETRVPRPA